MKKKYINIDEPTEIQITTPNCEAWVAYTPLTICKMFGPLIFADLRIRADLERGEWVIERRGCDEWKEWATVPSQLEDDFLCQDCYERMQENGECKNKCPQP